MDLYKKASLGLRAALQKTDWWEIVQDEVKERIEFILDNLEFLGIPFRDSFVAHFKYDNVARIVTGQCKGITQPGALFGKEMSDECYQCGKRAAKFLLDLDDWIDPNEADVQCCILICSQVDKLELLASSSSNPLGKLSSDPESLSN